MKTLNSDQIVQILTDVAWSVARQGHTRDDTQGIVQEFRDLIPLKYAHPINMDDSEYNHLMRLRSELLGASTTAAIHARGMDTPKSSNG